MNDNMTKMKAYQSPCILNTVEVALEKDFLAGSVVDSLNAGGLYTAPQAVEDVPLDSGDFNFVWE